MCLAFLCVWLPLLAPAAVVTVYSLKTDDTHFEIWAGASADDNAGIASYSIRLDNRTDIVISDCVNASPMTTFHGGPGSLLNVGFTLLRTCDSRTNRLTGAQDTLSGTVMVYHVGQSPGDLNALMPEGWTDLGGVQTCYGANVVLIKGTTDPGAPAPDLINGQDVMQFGVTYGVGMGTYFNVFISENGAATKSASCTLGDPSVVPTITLTPTPTPTPEPGATAAPTPNPQDQVTPTPEPSPFPLEEPTATPTPGAGPRPSPVSLVIDQATPTPIMSGTLYEWTMLGRRTCPGLGLIVLSSALAGLLVIVKCDEI